MIRIPKTVVSFGAVALAAGAFTLAVPRAAHSFAAALVQVTNNVDNPVQNQDVDALGRHPFLSSCSGQDSCTFSAVPVNKEWVIQTISVAINIPPSSPAAIAELETVTGGITGFPVQFPVASIIEGVGYSLQSVTAYADPGSTPICTYVPAPLLKGANISCSISGYAVSAP